jgi:hypothetical protein
MVESFHRFYSGCQKYIPIDWVNLSEVIASEAKQSDTKHRIASSQGSSQ